MAILSADRDTRSRDSEYASYPMAVDIVYKGGMVCLNASGFLAPAQDAVGFSRVVGIAAENQDNSGGSAGDLSCKVRSGRSFRFVTASIGTGDVGRMMYVTDDQTFEDIEGSFQIRAGILTERESSTIGWIHIPSPDEDIHTTGHRMLVRKVQISNAAMLLARATPVPLIRAPGANKTIIVDRVTFVCDDQGGAWTEPSAPENLVVEYADGVDITGAIESTSLVGQGAVVIESYGVLDTVIVPDVNAAVELFNTGSEEWGGGNAANSMSVIISYYIMDTVAFD